MQYASSASRTCIPDASTSECTATVLTPSFLAVRMIRHAISPRLAMRILSNGRDVVVAAFRDVFLKNRVVISELHGDNFVSEGRSKRNMFLSLETTTGSRERDRKMEEKKCSLGTKSIFFRKLFVSWALTLLCWSKER